MAFTLYKRGMAAQVPFEYLPSTASEPYTVGEALVLSSGALTKCTGTTIPEFICVEAYVAPSTGNRDILVYRILEDMQFATTFAADASSNAIGTLVTIHSDGAQVTATAADGVATIVRKDGTGASGTKCVVMFRR